MTEPVPVADCQQWQAWCDEGTAWFLALVGQLDDAALGGSSLLPGWSRLHLLSHVSRNGDALVNLLTWARTGVPSPMYASADQRAADIEAGALRPPAEVRADLAASCERFAAAVAAMAPSDWDAEVVSARGRPLAAAGVLWMRVREVWVHGPDLGSGATLHDLPAALVDALLDDVVVWVGGQAACPAVVLAGPPRQWRLGGAAAGAPVVVRGEPAALLGWSIGRTGPSGLTLDPPGDWPVLPPWL